MLDKHDPLKILALSAILTAGGCGGSSPSSVRVSIDHDDQAGALLLLEGDLGQRVLSEQFSDLTQVGPVGKASYDGTISGEIMGGVLTPISLLGSIRIETDFSNSSQGITGQVGDLVTTEGTEIGGTLKLVDGVIDTDGDPQVDHTVSGSLVGQIDFNDESGQFDVSLRIEGDFYGEGAPLIAGGANGIIVNGPNHSTFNGRFVASTIPD